MARKKSLVGWISSDWFKYFCLYQFTPTSNEMLQLIPFAEPKYDSDVKVHMTIKELPEKRRKGKRFF